MSKAILQTAASFISLVALASSHATAQEKTLFIAGWGGSFEKAVREDLIPDFVAKHGVRIEYTAGSSTDNLAKLQAQRVNQLFDVVFLDDGPMYQAIELGLCATISGLPITELVAGAVFKGGKAVGFSQTAAGITYNAKVFKERGWSPPTSWADLSNPRYKGVIGLPPITDTYGILPLIMLARLGGSGEYDIASGLKFVKEWVAPNVLTFPGSAEQDKLFQSGQILVSVASAARAQRLAAAGFPVEFVYPSEGAVSVLGAACPVVRSEVKPLASTFIKALLSAEFQTIAGNRHGWGPVNTRATVDPQNVKMAPVGHRASTLVRVDWDLINRHRPEWTKRWTREIER